MMTVSDLKDILEGLPDEAEVRLAEQPSWPFEYSVGEVQYDEDNNIVYIGEGQQLDYLSGCIKR